MRRSNQIPVEVDCEEMGLRKFPIAGYPLSYYKQNCDIRTIHSEGRCRFPSSPIHVQAYGIPVNSYKIPKYRLNYVNKYVDIPYVQKIQKVVEVPEIREITKYVDMVKVVDIPIDEVRMVPKLKIREIEKVRHIPGPIQYIEIPQEHIVHKPIKQIIEKIHEVPIIEDIEVEVPIYVPTPIGPPKDINIDIPLPYDVPQFCYKSDRLKNTFPIPIGYTNGNMSQGKLPTIKVVDNKNLMHSSPPLVYNSSQNQRRERNNRLNDRHNFADERLFNYDNTIRNRSQTSNTRNDLRNQDRNRERQYSNNNNNYYYSNANQMRNGNENSPINRNQSEEKTREEEHISNTCFADEQPRNYNDEENYIYEDNQNYVYGNEELDNEETHSQVHNHVTTELIVKHRHPRGL